MIDFNDKKQVETAMQYADEIVQNYYMSSEYNKAWNRFTKRIDAYHRRPSSSAAKWRSKLYFASYFVGIQAIDSQFKAAFSSDPYIFVLPSTSSKYNQNAKDMAKIAHFDLNYDLRISNFKTKLFNMLFYLELFGTAIGREYIRTKQTTVKQKRRVMDVFGIDRGTQTDEQINRTEYTATDVIHPLNFAHDLTKRDFIESEWASVRFELPLSELYNMVDNPIYYQPGIQEILKSVDDKDTGKYDVSKTEFYSERGSDVLDKQNIIVYECSMPLRISGNIRDNTRYYMLYSRQYNQVLQISETPFARHPYWKLSTYQPPDGPYGIGAQDTLLPINEWENFTINQYNDWMTAALKFMYEVQPENIAGGINMLINGLPNGMIQLEKDILPGQTIKGIDTNKSSIPAVQDIINMIEKAKQEYGASSNLRGRDSGSNADTATGIRLLAEREDSTIASMLDGIDLGIIDGMHLKLQNSSEFFTQPREATFKNEEKDLIQHVKYYPYEYSGIDFSFNIKRELGDNEVGKHMSFLKLLSGLDQALAQKGTPIPAATYIDIIEQIGISIGVDNMDKIINDLKSAQPMAPAVGGMPGQPAPGVPGQPGPMPSPVGSTKGIPEVPSAISLA